MIFDENFQAMCLVGAHTFRSGPRPGHTPWGHTCVGKVVRPRSDTYSLQPQGPKTKKNLNLNLYFLDGRKQREKSKQAKYAKPLEIVSRSKITNKIS